MPSEETPNVPATRNSREAVREKAQLVQAQQRRHRWIRRGIIAGVGVAAVSALTVGVVMAVGSTAAKPMLNPSGMTDDGVQVSEITTRLLVPGAASASPEPTASGDEAAAESEAAETAEDDAPKPGVADIHIYVDYLAEGAGDFERANARQLSTWLAEGAVQLTYHPVALLTASSNGTKYSLRSAAAAACVATHSPDHFSAYNHELLVNQPAPDSGGRSDVELADLAVAVGIDSAKTVRSCIEGHDYVNWAKEATARALKGPLPDTDDLVLTAAPMIVVNGTPYVGALDNAAEFSQFVMSVASDDYYSTPTPTPSPSS